MAITRRSLRDHTLTLDDLRAVVRETVRAEFAGGSIRKVIDRMIAQAARGDELAVDFVVHDGDLHVAGDLVTGLQPYIGILIVRGDLEVSGRFETTLDPDSADVVTGDLRVQRMASAGFLEVHGSVIAERESLWLDNDGCAEIFGDLRSAFAFTKYHAVKVHGRVESPLIVGDHPRFESPHAYVFLNETDPVHKHLLRAQLPRAALAFAGQHEEPDGEWWIEYIDSHVLLRHLRAGTPIVGPAASSSHAP
jgi:hypothetical protein